MEPKNAVLAAAFVLMMLTLVLAPTPAASAQDAPRVAQYAGRASLSLCYMQSGLANGQSLPGLGSCVFTVEPGEARVVLQDWSEPSVSFRYALFNVLGEYCEEGEALDEVVLAVERPCNYLSVTPGQRAVAGQVFVL